MHFITISEMLGTHGETIGRNVARALEYPFYGEQELLNAAKELEIFPGSEMLDEKAPSFLERIFSERPRVDLARLQSLIYRVAAKGDGVFFGRGSHLLLDAFDCAFHVLIAGSHSKRMERLMGEMTVDRETAQSMIDRSDHEKKSFIQFAFNDDWLNFRLYDLVLNTDKLSVESAAKAVIDLAESKEIKACGVDSVNTLRKLSVASWTESAFREAGVSPYHLFFEVEDPETVRLYGTVTSREEKGRVESVVKRGKGIRNIRNDIAVINQAGA
jgi:cytidylate kinase